ncbi:type II toxin-antitoxin system RelE/ParE family toxin [Arsenicitalea aurantiaca]|uniref:Type II toxin-antitoxin system RelE/ParE family toxin n=1 Tax=Arsenicitalea aurantiaca TaxID=1783274 RepID=A0A433XG68_9HYPH|nr:type II toxin-antitoxin system RelE/ParE family toxin [Arsenicitalea aurantiaca]RUT33083.1 type II toxin-antitoxin system RelE/ParE family toxin [Arsenicitalea aurantiaca]
MRIRWSEEAVLQLEAITSYIGQFNQTAAFALQERIEQAVLPAADHPYLFRSGRVGGTREIVAHPNYIVVYRVGDDAVTVVSVMHARQRYP